MVTGREEIVPAQDLVRARARISVRARAWRLYVVRTYVAGGLASREPDVFCARTYIARAVYCARIIRARANTSGSRDYVARCANVCAAPLRICGVHVHLYSPQKETSKFSRQRRMGMW